MRTETQGRVKGRKNSKVVKFIICVHFHLSLPMTLKRKWEFLCACVYASLFFFFFFFFLCCVLFFLCCPSKSIQLQFVSVLLPFLLPTLLLLFPLPSIRLGILPPHCLHLTPPSFLSYSTVPFAFFSFPPLLCFLLSSHLPAVYCLLPPYFTFILTTHVPRPQFSSYSFPFLFFPF